MQQLHMPPAIMLHRFCIMLHAIGSSHMQLIFMPPCIFSNFIVHRGIIMPGMAVPPIAEAPMPIRSIIGFIMGFIIIGFIIVLFICSS
jgi:hypothetical protein